MALIGYHASHEQFDPAALLSYVRRAEQAGFCCAMCSDHFAPWSETQGQSGYAWSWLGAALQATTLSFGTVCAPGQRYHPAIVAQAAATLEVMYPGRFWLALGSGQLLNEHITGQRWPTKPERQERLYEAAQVIRALWNGATVTHRGTFTVSEAKLYTRPAKPPLLVAAAITRETAEWAAAWADAVITVVKPLEDQKRFVEAWRNSGGADKPMFLQAQISYAPTDEEALASAHDPWRINLLDSKVLSDLSHPAQFDVIGQVVRPGDLASRMRISSDPGRHIAWLQEDLELGFDRIMIHNANRSQSRFIDFFGEHVLPSLRTSEP